MVLARQTLFDLQERLPLTSSDLHQFVILTLGSSKEETKVCEKAVAKVKALLKPPIGFTPRSPSATFRRLRDGLPARGLLEQTWPPLLIQLVQIGIDFCRVGNCHIDERLGRRGAVGSTALKQGDAASPDGRQEGDRAEAWLPAYHGIRQDGRQASRTDDLHDGGNRIRVHGYAGTNAVLPHVLVDCRSGCEARVEQHEALVGQLLDSHRPLPADQGMPCADDQAQPFRVKGLSVPKIRFCNIGGEGRRGWVVM
jgi:hypothetical protein